MNKMNYTYAILALVSTVFHLVTGDDTPVDDDKLHLCGSDITIDCVKQYFKENGECSEVSTPNENPHYAINLPMYLAKLNLTVISTDLYPSTKNAEFEQFYINERSGNLVISVKFNNLFCEAPGLIFSLDQRGRENKVFQEYVNVTYPPLVITAVLPKIDEVDADSIRLGTISAYFLSNDAAFNIGPKFTQSSDELVSDVFETFAASIPEALPEIFRTKAAFYFLSFMQNYICDFGVKPDVQSSYDTTVINKIMDVDTNDETSFTKPCEQSDDVTNCVRDFFEDNGKCSVIRQTDDDTVVREILKFYVPNQNVTAVSIFSQLSGLDGKIEQFYKNEKTQNLVMSVRFDGIQRVSTAVPYMYSQRGQEPKVVQEWSNDTFPCVLTATIPMDDGLSPEALESAIISAYFPEPNVVFRSLHLQKKSQDPDIISTIYAVEENTTLIAQEVFVTEAYSMFMAYLQKYIYNCDLGLSRI